MKKILFKELVVYGHHASVSFQVEECINSVGVDLINHIRTFPFRLELAFRLMSEDHWPSHREDQISFLEGPMAVVESSSHPCLV